MTTTPSRPDDKELAAALEACEHLGYAPVITTLVAELRQLRDRVAELESAAAADLTTALAQALAGADDRDVAITSEQVREWVRQIGDPPIEIPETEP